MSGFILILAGIFTVVATQSEWEWYWNDRRARMWIGIFGKDGARIALTILGVIIIIFGIILMFRG